MSEQQRFTAEVRGEAEGKVFIFQVEACESLSKCTDYGSVKGCGAAVRWARTKKGNNMLIEVEPGEDGIYSPHRGQCKHTGFPGTQRQQAARASSPRGPSAPTQRTSAPRGDQQDSLDDVRAMLEERIDALLKRVQALEAENARRSGPAREADRAPVPTIERDPMLDGFADDPPF